MEKNPLAKFDGEKIDGLKFCSLVYKLFDDVRDSEDGPSRLRMRPSSLEKRLLEELLPICKYVQESYRTGRYISVCWMDGNQTYDAEIFQKGAYISENYYPAHGYLEVTCTMHPNEYLSREMLETKGYAYGLEGIRRLENGEIESTPVGFTNDDFIPPYVELVLDQINKKANKPYPDNTILIVKCTMNTVYMPDEWESFITQVKAGLPEHSFDEIYLYDDIGLRSKTFYPKHDL